MWSQQAHATEFERKLQNVNVRFAQLITHPLPPCSTHGDAHSNITLESIMQGKQAKPSECNFTSDEDSTFIAGTTHNLAVRQQWCKTLQHHPEVLQQIVTGGDLFKHIQPFKGVCDGIEYDSELPPQIIIPNRPSAHKHPQFVAKTIAKYLKSGAIAEWGDTSEVPPWLTLPLHVVEEKAGALRMCYDCSFFNLWLMDCPFTLDTMFMFATMLSVVDPTSLGSCDFKGWYTEHLVHVLSAPLLGFQWGGTRYVYMHPGFGIKIAGFLCERPARPVMDHMRDHLKIRIARYIDDSLTAPILHLLQHMAETGALHATMAAVVIAFT